MAVLGQCDVHETDGLNQWRLNPLPEDYMKKILVIALALITGFAMTLYAQATLTPDKIPRMSIEELKRQIDNPNLIVVDVRSSHDWEESATKITGSVREDASNTINWIAKYPPNKTIVFYCA
jgi:hypothetical protein